MVSLDYNLSSGLFDMISIMIGFLFFFEIQIFRMIPLIFQGINEA